MSKKIAILTGGGDCPGLNAVIRAVARKSFPRGYELVGALEGWRGMLEPNFKPLGPADVSGILHRGGTIIGTSRTNPYNVEGGVEKLRKNFSDAGLDALIAMGGEDTLGVAAKLYDEFKFPVVGVPKTIDNDLSGTDYTFGFDTAVSIATEAIDRLHTTAESHKRVLVVEIMGRHAGWMTVHAGIAGGADAILIPEQKTTVEEVCEHLKKRWNSGKKFGIVAVSEGYELTFAGGKSEMVAKDAPATDQFGHIILGGVGEALSKEIEKQTGYETRSVVLGHTQRGGTPTSRDRVLATRYGLKAADLVHEGNFGQMAALRGDDIVGVSLHEATAELKTVPQEWFDTAKAAIGWL